MEETFIKNLSLLLNMGRIKSRFVKSSGSRIFNKVKPELSEDFDKNKEVVAKYADIPSKKLRNSIVGYVTRLHKQENQQEE